MSLMFGGVAFALSLAVDSATDSTVVLGIGISVFVAGVAFVTQFLVDVDARTVDVVAGQRALDRGLVGYADEVRRLAGQRDVDSEQLRLLIRYVEEQIPRIISETFDLKQREEPLVRELSHSLNTPLAHIEATLLSGPHIPEQLRAELLASVEICKAFLSAFRQLATRSHDSQAWEPHSLESMLVAASQLYAARAQKSLTFGIAFPTDIPGYGRNYLAALLLPLLENAVEASPSGRRIAVAVSDEGADHVISVSNDCELGVVLGDEIYMPTWSSKQGHHGLGLATVRSLLGAHAGSSLNHVVDDDGRVTFTVTLVRRRSHDG